MTDLDLHALGAPIEQLKPQVIQAYQRLNKKWGAVAARLKELRLPCRVSFVYCSDAEFDYRECLEWRKLGGRHRICMATYAPSHNGDSIDETVTPYEEWSGETRIDMLRHVPGLFEEAASAVQKFIERAGG